MEEKRNLAIERSMKAPVGAVARGSAGLGFPWDETPCAGSESPEGREGKEGVSAKGSEGGGGEKRDEDDDDGFFAVLRRKLFERRDSSSDSGMSLSENKSSPSLPWGERKTVEAAAMTPTSASGSSAEARSLPLRPGPKVRTIASDGIGGGSPSVDPPSASGTGGSTAGAVTTSLYTAPTRRRQQSGSVAIRGVTVTSRARQTSAAVIPLTRTLAQPEAIYSRGSLQNSNAAARGVRQNSVTLRAVSGTTHFEGGDSTAYPADAGAGRVRPADVSQAEEVVGGNRSVEGQSARSGYGIRREQTTTKVSITPEVAAEAAAKFGLVRMVFGDDHKG